jgi:hypothetical protein
VAEAGAPGCSRDKEGRVMRLEMGRRAATDVDSKGGRSDGDRGIRARWRSRQRLRPA